MGIGYWCSGGGKVCYKEDYDRAFATEIRTTKAATIGVVKMRSSASVAASISTGASMSTSGKTASNTKQSMKSSTNARRRYINMGLKKIEK